MSLPLAAALLLLSALAPACALAAAVDVRVLGRDGQPLADAVVFLESPAAKAASRPQAGVEIGQANKQFEHRVSVIQAGTEVLFPNRDKVRHHVYSFSPAKTFELKLYAGTPANPVLFDKPGIAVLGCNIHDNMIAWVLVLETPHHGLSADSGQARIDNVPPGGYRLRAWHPELPFGTEVLDQALTVAAAGASASVTLPVAGTGRP